MSFGERPTRMGGDNDSDFTCAKWEALFSNFNHYFRDEDVIQGTEHASVGIGIVIFCLYSFVIAFGACGNLLTFSAVIRNPAMRTNRNLFIVNLAMSDFLLCTVTAPTTLYTILYFFWPFGTVMCKMAGSLQGFNIFVSSFSISSIGLDRYVVIIFPTKRDRQRHFMLFCFAFIWLISFGLAVPLLIASDLKPIHHDPFCNLYYDICHEQNNIWREMIVSKEVYTCAVLAIQYLLPLVSLVFVYSRIASRMGARIRGRPALQANNQRRRSVAGRQRRTNLLLVGIVTVFAISWLPLNIFHVLNTFGLSSSFHVPTFAVCHVIGMTSACSNPVLYGVLNENFRVEFVAILDRLGVLPVLRVLRRTLCKTCHDKAKTGASSSTLTQTAANDYTNANMLPMTQAEIVRSTVADDPPTIPTPQSARNGSSYQATVNANDGSVTLTPASTAERTPLNSDGDGDADGYGDADEDEWRPNRLRKFSATSEEFILDDLVVIVNTV